MSESFLNGRVTLHAGDSREVLKTLADNSIDSIVTDPPYALVSITKRFGAEPVSNMHTQAAEQPPNRGAQYKRLSKGFMGKQWDTGETAFAVEFWQQCLRVLKPGGHCVAFSGTRTYHRMACAIEDAGFEIRDQLQWVYGSGFPKSHDVAKGLDKAAGHWRGRAGAITIQEQPAKGTEYERTDKGEPISDSAIQWQGWGTALKPSCEPICFGRKPLSERTVAANVLAHGVGAINIDGCRVETEDEAKPRVNQKQDEYFCGKKPVTQIPFQNGGRWPANILHDGSDEVLAGFPVVGDSHPPANAGSIRKNEIYGADIAPRTFHAGFPDSGSAARFFYTAKADALDRAGSRHPTVKPLDLIQWLCRLVTPPGGTILDCFAGTGTTGEAAFREGFNAVLIERELEYQADIRRRMALVLSGPDERARESIKARLKDTPVNHGPLFGGLDAIAEAAE